MKACEKLVLGQTAVALGVLSRLKPAAQSSLVVRETRLSCTGCVVNRQMHKIDLGSAVSVASAVTASSCSNIIIPGQWLGKIKLCSQTDMQYRKD